MLRSTRTFLLLATGLAATTIGATRAKADFIDEDFTYRLSGVISEVDAYGENVYTGQGVNLMPDVHDGDPIFGFARFTGTYDTLTGEFDRGGGMVSFNVTGSTLRFHTFVDLYSGSTLDRIALLSDGEQNVHSAVLPSLTDFDDLTNLLLVLTPGEGELTMHFDHPSYQLAVDSFEVDARLTATRLAPEPSSFVLLGLGLVGCCPLAKRWKRRLARPQEGVGAAL